MTKSKSTKRAMLGSAISLLLCFAMLLGTTFAWFTDNVTSADNRIIAGDLEIDLLMDKLENGSYASIAGGTGDIFSEATGNGINWEPGKTEIVYLAVENKGSLALKYNIMLDITDGGLIGSLEYAVIDGATAEDLSSATKWADIKAYAGAQVGDVTAGEITVAPNGKLDEIALNGTKNERDYFALAVHMKEEAGNEYENKNITIDVKVVATQVEAEDDSFGKEYDKDAAFDLPPVTVTPDKLSSIDFTEENRAFEFSGNYDAVTIAELGEGSVILFNDAEIGTLTINDDAAATGSATINSINLKRDSIEPVELTLADAAITFTGAINVTNTLGKSILNIENSTIKASSIFVGEHTNNHTAALAEFNVINSYLSCEENSLGSTIAVWGASGVDSKIYDSEIHTYSRGWHQSEDANDNSITFQATEYINVDIKRSNMHLYGARSIVNARAYGGNPDINFTIDESLIWVVTKSRHAEETLPVWNATKIDDSALIFTKGVYGSDPVVIKTDLYGNPVIHGNYAVTTQCGWETTIALADGQTVTIAKDANVSIYEDAADVNFVLTGSAKVVVEEGATLTNIGVKAADGYTLNTATSNGNTVYSVTAN